MADSSDGKWFCAGLRARGYRPYQCGKLSGDPATVFFRTYGRGPIKVIFCSGMGTRGDMWLQQCQHLTSLGDFEALVVDNRGAGQTQPGSRLAFGRCTTRLMAQDLAEIATSLGWARMGAGVHIIGISMGGMIAQELALLLLPSLRSLTLMSTHAGGDHPFRPALAPLAGAAGVLRVGVERAIARGAEGIIEAKFRLITGPRFNSPARQALRDRTKASRVAKYRRLGPPVHTPLGRFGQFCAVHTHKVSDQRLARIRDSTATCVVIRGTHDKLVAAGHSDHLARALRCPLYILDGVGHAPHLEEPEFVNKLIVDTMRSAERAAVAWRIDAMRSKL